MKCEEFGRLLDNYENLTDNEKSEMDRHADMCEKCRQELDFFISMLSTVRTLPAIEPPADFIDTLNARLDAEDNKPSQNKIVYHIRKNWKQYASLAACIALVAVLTANRSILLDRIEGTEDGVVTTDTVSDGDDAATIDGFTVASGGETVNGDAQQIEAAEQPSAAEQPASAEASAPKSGTRRTGRTAAFSERVASSGAVSESADWYDNVSEWDYSYAADNTDADNYVISESITVASAGEQNYVETAQSPAETSEKQDTKKKYDDYGIALKNAIVGTDAEMSVAYDMKPEEVSASLRASKIIDGYSLADGGETIALGVYYAIDQNGKPIMTEEKNAIKAVGSLKISSDDAEKAMEILNQYPHDESGNVYTTGSENVDGILSNLNDEDVTYTNYIVGGSDDVKFRIEFN